MGFVASRVHAPRGERIPLVFDSPHSGRAVPDYVTPAAPASVLRTSWDAFVDELYAVAPDHGCALVTATFPRWLIDPNRARDDIDPELLAEPWPEPVNVTEKSRKGQGLIRRYALPGVPVYDRRLAVAEVRRLIDELYDPYQQAVRTQLDACFAQHGVVWHVNCHSMKSRGNAMNPDEGKVRPDFVVSDREGTTTERAFLDCIVATLRDLGYRVSINDPYKGAELVRAWSDPTRGRHSVQVEVNRALYMDETRCEKHDGFDGLVRDIAKLVEVLAHFVRSRIHGRTTP